MAVPDILLLPPPEAARELLGWRFTTVVDDLRTSVVLTEVEAYGGDDDPASHAFSGRTERNGSMFLGAGHLYVYLSYGIHYLANIVVGEEGNPGAVLLRAGVPLEGAEVMQQRRGRESDLASGPGKLAQALGVSLAHDGARIGEDFCEIEPGLPSGAVQSGPRVGISKAVARPWRYRVGRM